MPRISDPDRLPMINAHLAHYAQAEIINGGPILLEPGVGLPQLQTQRTLFVALDDEVLLIRETTLPNLRSERDGIWGINPNDTNGVWLRLTQYKNLVKTRLGPRHPLARIVPNLGDIAIERYVTITHRFLNYWALVNPALPSPLVLGTFTIALLQTAHDNRHTKIEDIEAQETLARLRNEQQEELFGDEPEDEREPTSIIARLLLYQATIQALFPNQPIADSLPQIFPPGANTPLPTFGFNWVLQPGGVVKLWYNPPTPALTAAALVFLREGATELTSPVSSTTPGSTSVQTFSGLTVVGELDRLELRNGNGLSIARGVRNTALAEPT